MSSVCDICDGCYDKRIIGCGCEYDYCSKCVENYGMMSGWYVQCMRCNILGDMIEKFEYVLIPDTVSSSSRLGESESYRVAYILVDRLLEKGREE